MDLEDIMLSEIGQTQKNKYRYDLTYLWNPKKEKKKPTKFTDTQNRNRLVQRSQFEGRVGEMGTGSQKIQNNKPCM